MELKINKEFTELVYCHKHKCWYQVDDEMNCCQIEFEQQLADLDQ